MISACSGDRLAGFPRVVEADDDDRAEQDVIGAVGAGEEGGGLVDRLAGGGAVLVEPRFPASGDLDPLGAVRADEFPDREPEPCVSFAGQVSFPGRGADGDEQDLHFLS
jgi:hypothetical protein